MVAVYVSIILLILNCVLIFKAYIMGHRGTNTVTRFVRNAASHAVYGRLIVYAVVSFTLMLLLGLIAGKPWVCIFQIIPLGITLFLMSKDVKNKQRISDSRNVTKGTLQVVGESGETIGTVGGLVVSKSTGLPMQVCAKAGGVVGKAAGKGFLSAAESMTDVDVDMQGTGIQLDNPEAFIEAASHAGIPVEGRDLNEIYVDAKRLIPQVRLDEFPESMSDEEKLKRALLPGGGSAC